MLLALTRTVQSEDGRVDCRSIGLEVELDSVLLRLLEQLLRLLFFVEHFLLRFRSILLLGQRVLLYTYLSKPQITCDGHLNSNK